MKKKWILLQSVILLAVAAVLLTVASVAWFMPAKASVSGFDVNVTRGLKLNIRLFRVENGTDTEITQDASLVPEELYPGKTAEYRIDIVNAGSACTLRISFTGIAVTGGTNDLKVELAGGNVLDFVPDAFGTLTIAENVSLGENAAVSVVYRYYLGNQAKPSDTVGAIAIKGISFTAV